MDTQSHRDHGLAAPSAPRPTPWRRAACAASVVGLTALPNATRFLQRLHLNPRAMPHFVVLFFLWIAFAVVSVVAFFAILATGRYPRRLFEFGVGLIRWVLGRSFYM